MFALFGSEIFLPAVILYYMTVAAFTGRLRKLNFLFNPLLLTAKFFSFLILLTVFVLINNITELEPVYFIQGLIFDNLGYYARFFIYFTAIPVTLFFYRFYTVSEFKPPYELFILIGYSIVGMVYLTTTTDILLAYVFIELQALSFYLLAATNRYDVYSLEAGLKYFVLGGLSSVSLLFGFSLLYGLTGTTNLLVMSELTHNLFGYADYLFIFAFSLILLTFMFKLSAFPFHFWTPDVYTGSPLPVTAFFGIVTKLGYLIFLIRFTFYLNSLGASTFFYFLMFCGLSTIIIGSFGAIFQTNLKRFLAYSTINNIGFILLALATGTTYGYTAATFYLVVYMAVSVGLFSFLFLYSNANLPTPFIEKLADLKTISKTNFSAAIVLSFFILSFAGVPPLAGFFSKYFIFAALVDSKNYVPAFFAALLSIFSAFYYLRLIKYLFFLDTSFSVTRLNSSWFISYVFAFTAIVNLFFILFYEKLLVYISFFLSSSFI